MSTARDKIRPLVEEAVGAARADEALDVIYGAVKKLKDKPYNESEVGRAIARAMDAKFGDDSCPRPSVNVAICWDGGLLIHSELNGKRATPSAAFYMAFK